MPTATNTGPFYIVAHERGLEGAMLPTWTDRGAGVIDFDVEPGEVTRVEVDGVPGAFQLENVLSPREVAQLVDAAEAMGFHPDSPVSLPRSVRHNHNVNWVVSETIDATLWERSRHLITERVDGQVARGINARFRFYRYTKGDYFSPHTDGAWPGSRVVDGQLVGQLDPSLYSKYTYLILLNDDFEGGETEFLVSASDPRQPARLASDARRVSIRTPAGGVLCFPHGNHPLHCVHSSRPITKGQKYIIRTDLLFGPTEPAREEVGR